MTTPTDIERIEAELREGPLKCGPHDGFMCDICWTVPETARFIANRERKLREAVVEECAEVAHSLCMKLTGEESRALAITAQQIRALAPREGE